MFAVTEYLPLSARVFLEYLTNDRTAAAAALLQAPRLLYVRSFLTFIVLMSIMFSLETCTCVCTRATIMVNTYIARKMARERERC